MDYVASEDIRSELAGMQPYRIWEMEGLKASRPADNFYVYMDTYAALYSSDIEWAPLPCSYDVVSFRGGDAIDRTESVSRCRLRRERPRGGERRTARRSSSESS